jgi:hypothetical protein
MDYNQKKERAIKSLSNQVGLMANLAGYNPSEEEIVSEVQRLQEQDDRLAAIEEQRQLQELQNQKENEQLKQTVQKSPDLRTQAQRSLADRGGNSSYIAPTDEQLVSEMERQNELNIAKSKQAQADSEAEFDKNLDVQYRKKALGWSSNMDPKVQEYAKELFPQLFPDVAAAIPTSNIQIPLAPPSPEQPKVAAQSMEASISPEKLQQQAAPSQEQTAPSLQSTMGSKQRMISGEQPIAQTEPSAQTPERTSVEDMIAQATEAEGNARLQKSMAQFRNAIIGAGLGREYKGDLSGYDERIKSSKKPLENLLLKQELQSSEAKNDPNSAISVLVRKSLQEIGGINMQGLEKVSYAQLEKLYPSLAQSLYNKTVAEARLKEAEAAKVIASQTAADKKQAKLEAEKESDYRDLYKKSKSVTDSDAFSLYKQAIGANRQLDQALAAWNQSGEAYKVQTSAAFMNYAKTAQQDKSVVRESDMKVLAGGINYGNLGSLVSKFAAKGAGSAFSPEELKQFKAVMNTIANIKRTEIKQNLNPILKKAKESNLDTSYLIDPEVIDDIYNQPPTLQEQMSQIEQRLKSSQSRIDELKKKQGSK